MTQSDTYTLLLTILRSRAEPAGWSWFDGARPTTPEPVDIDRLLTVYAGATRRLGRTSVGAVALDEAEQNAAEPAPRRAPTRPLGSGRNWTRAATPVAGRGGHRGHLCRAGPGLLHERSGPRTGRAGCVVWSCCRGASGSSKRRSMRVARTSCRSSSRSPARTRTRAVTFRNRASTNWF